MSSGDSADRDPDEAPQAARTFRELMATLGRDTPRKLASLAETRKAIRGVGKRGAGRK